MIIFIITYAQPALLTLLSLSTLVYAYATNNRQRAKNTINFQLSALFLFLALTQTANLIKLQFLPLAIATIIMIIVATKSTIQKALHEERQFIKETKQWTQQT